MDAFCSAGPAERRAPAGRRLGQIHALYVSPEAWGRGIGRRLTDLALARLDAESDRLSALKVEHAAVSAQAGERAKLLAAERANAATVETERRLDFGLVVSEVEEKEQELLAARAAERAAAAKLVEAEEQLQRVLQQRPDYDEALLLLGRIELERGHEDAAREAWIRVQNGAAAVQARAFVNNLDAGRPAARIDETGDPPPTGWGAG